MITNLCGEIEPLTFIKKILSNSFFFLPKQFCEVDSRLPDLGHWLKRNISNSSIESGNNISSNVSSNSH